VRALDVAAHQRAVGREHHLGDGGDAHLVGVERGEVGRSFSGSIGKMRAEV
jgi:hypothetical protein